MSSTFLEEQFRCSVCVDIFKNPASIPCGHNFCLGCIKRYWDTRSKADCPLCKETFRSRPKLCVNLAFRDVIDQIKRISNNPIRQKPPPRHRRSKQSSNLYDVFCDECEKEGLEQSLAVKSCLVCRESYCENHLVPHLRDPVLTKHMLTDPGTFISSHTCRRHCLLLEMFCKTDQQLVCFKCEEREHKHHEVVSIEKESHRVRSEMKKAEVDFHHLIKARTKKIQELKESLDQGKKLKEEELQRSLQVLQVVKVGMESQQGALVEQSEAKQLELEKRHERLNKQLNLELNELNRRRGKIYQLELIDDPLHLIQSFRSLMAPGFTHDVSQLKFQVGGSVSAVREAFSKMVDFCLDVQTQLTREELSLMTQYAVDVTLDPCTAAGWLVLSANGKQVSVNPQTRRSSLYDDPKRFDSCVSVLGKQSFSCGRHYWVVQVGDKTDWDLGVAKESINRKGAITVSPDCGFWAICRRKSGCLSGCLSACTSPSVPLPLKETPQLVGIFLDHNEGQVSFYDAENKVHIYTFSNCAFAEPLHPYFNPCLRDNGKNTGPLVISSVEAVISGGSDFL